MDLRGAEKARALDGEADGIRKAKSSPDYWAISEKKLAEASKHRSTAEQLERQIKRRREESRLLASELETRAAPRPGETVRDLARRWFSQREGETLSEYGNRMAARRTMVEEEATRSGGTPEVAALHDDVLRSIGQRSASLATAQQDLELAEKAARAAREEWHQVTDSLRKERKGPADLTPGDQAKEGLWIQKEKQLEAARQAVRKAEFGIDRVGALGESIAARYLASQGYTNIRSIQNASGHGIDLVADRGAKTYFFEVKSSENAYAPSLSSRQQNMDWFVKDVLNTSSSPEAKALLDRIRAGTLPIEGSLIEITDINMVSGASRPPRICPW